MAARRPVFPALGLVTILSFCLPPMPTYASTCDFRKMIKRPGSKTRDMTPPQFYEACTRFMSESADRSAEALDNWLHAEARRKAAIEAARTAREKAADEAARKREMERLRGPLEAEKAKLREMEERNRKAEEDGRRAREKYELDKMRREEEKAVERFLHPEKSPEKPKPPTLGPLGSTGMGERGPGGIRLGVKPTGNNADLSDVRSRVLNLSH